jgi:hypothetical protein
VAGHRRCGPDGDVAVRVSVGLERCRPQSGRVRVEAQDDLAAPLVYESGQPVGKRRLRRR